MKYDYIIKEINLPYSGLMIWVSAMKGNIEMKAGKVESIDAIPTMIKAMEQDEI